VRVLSGVLPDTALGTGTSMLRTAGLSTVFGYSRSTRTCRESGSVTGEKRMYVPCWVMSVSPARRGLGPQPGHPPAS